MRIHTILLVATLALGCTPAGDGDGGGGNGGQGGGVDGGIPPGSAAFADRIAGFYCEYIQTCGVADDDFLFLRQLIEGGGDCTAWLSPEFDLPDTVVDGLAEVDEGALDRCIRRVLETCVDLGDVSDCRDVVVGRRAVGEDCFDDEVCAPGLYCAFGGPAGEGECGDSCQPRLAAGEACDYSGQCADDGDRMGHCAQDDDVGGTGTCVTTRLGAPAAAGAQCGFVEDEGGPTRIGCAPGLFCTAFGGGSGVCRTPIPLGDPCQSDDDPCDGGLCIDGVCTALDIRTAPGDACDNDRLTLCSPVAGLQCVDGICASSDGSQGALCARGDGGVRCQRGLYCDDDGICRAQQPEGAACDPDSDWNTCLTDYCERQPDDSGLCARDTFDDVCR